MRYVRQFGIILVISLLGEVLHALLPLPIPAGIYGIVLLFTALEAKLLKLDAIRETSAFLLEVMPVMFVPAGVELMEKWGLLRPVWLPFVVIIIVSTILVLAVSGFVTQCVVRSRGNKEDETDA